MKIRNMLPFLDTEEVDLLLEKVAEKEIEGIRLEELLPFVSSKKLTEVYRKMAASGKFDTSRFNKTSFFPFLPREALHLLVEDYVSGKIASLPDSVLPFLSSEDIKVLMKYELNKKFSDAAQKEERENASKEDKDGDDDDDEEHDDEEDEEHDDDEDEEEEHEDDEDEHD